MFFLEMLSIFLEFFMVKNTSDQDLYQLSWLSLTTILIHNKTLRIRNILNQCSGRFWASRIC